MGIFDYHNLLNKNKQLKREEWRVKKITKKTSVVIFFVAIFFVSFAGISFAKSKEISFRGYAQIETNWCWAANGQGILNYYSKTVTQCQFVKDGKGTTSCENDGGTDNQVNTGLKTKRVTSSNYYGNLTIVDVFKEIDAGRPVYVNWQWTNREIGHAVTIYGYNQTIDPYRNYIKYSDPSYGAKVTIDYATFNKDGSGRYWNSGLRNITK